MIIKSWTEYEPGTVEKINIQPRKAGNQSNAQKTKYKDVICAFDIESTYLPFVGDSIMYIWQFAIGADKVFIGRTWKEFNLFLNKLESELAGSTLCIYVHNLSYEFAFLSGIYNFASDEVFAVDSRKVLKCTMRKKAFEFRCSYLHSNMSLSAFTKKMGVKHGKLSGEEFNYTRIRLPWTPLTEHEIEYCVNDVVGLVEALEIEMEKEKDNLYSIPLTSTGYVRRDCRRALHDIQPKIRLLFPDLELYFLLREAFRGGNTHANRYYADRILYNVKSCDRSSSYPEVICNRDFPITPFEKMEGKISITRLLKKISSGKTAWVGRIVMENVSLRDEFDGCPYLSKDKCRNVTKAAIDNGRILSSEYLETSVTDVDLKIIVKQYKADITIADGYVAGYGKLPRELRRLVIKYFTKKTKLKGDSSQAYYYAKAKELLNAIYGMMAQDPLKESILFDSSGNGEHGKETWKKDESKTKEDLLSKYLKSGFLPYQWGVWVTAWARYELQCGIEIVGHNFVYADTDSVKYIGEADFSAYNSDKIKLSKLNNACADDSIGNTHYMGVYEPEESYARFKTLGAKKYAYQYNLLDSDKVILTDGTHVTIAGVTKSKGGVELDKHGGLTAFREGFLFREAGGTESIYNDSPIGRMVEINDHQLRITRNVSIVQSTYEVGLSAEYREILNYGKLLIDNWAEL